MRTAEEFLRENFEANAINPSILIEFAKMHVKAALEAASKKAGIKQDWSGNTGSEYCEEYVDKESILNAYPETNIK